MSEIRLRAIAQIGKTSWELEKAKPNKGHSLKRESQFASLTAMNNSLLPTSNSRGS
jgi:hypothetical protein